MIRPPTRASTLPSARYPANAAVHSGRYRGDGVPYRASRPTSTGGSAPHPLTIAELTPFLERAERAIGVSASTPTRGIRRSVTRCRLFLQRCRRGDGGGQPLWHPRHRRAGRRVVAARHEARCQHLGACTDCGYCHQGCRTGAKGSTDLTFLSRAVRHGVECNDRGALGAVVYRGPEGQDHRQACRLVFLCTGAIETPRLLLHTGL